jgi:hypothetical protein
MPNLMNFCTLTNSQWTLRALAVAVLEDLLAKLTRGVLADVNSGSARDRKPSATLATRSSTLRGAGGATLRLSRSERFSY